MSVTVLKQVVSEAPPLLTQALPDELFSKLKMDRIPVLIMKPQSDALGWCVIDPDHTELGEVVLS